MSEQNYKEKYELLEKEFQDFVYIISHDIKSPLRAIQNITEWIEEDINDNNLESVAENFEDLKDRVNRMNNMIDALTLISRINSRTNEEGELNVKIALSEIKERIEFEYKNLTIEIDSPEIKLITYPQKFNQVISELIENAVKHNQELHGLKVSIKVVESTDDIIIDIQDNGCGIEADFVEKVFNLFYTIKNKDDFYTTGAGLTVVKKTLDFIGGNISANPESQKGAHLRINWPKTK